MGIGLHKLKYALNHPLTRHKKIKTIKRFVSWKINNLINPYPVILPFAEGTSLIVHKNIPGDEMNLYTGLSEFPEMGFLLHSLRENDLFIDIGANVGSFSVLASGVCKANSLTIEPIPNTFKVILKNILINNLANKVTPLNIGLGEKKSILRFTNDSGDVLNHVLTNDDRNQQSIEVPVECLDDLLNGRSPFLLKVDVEGFEMNVLKGAAETLKDKNLNAIIIEMNGLGKRYGHADIDLHNYITGFEFVPCSYDPIARNLKTEDSYIIPNTIYIRDIDLANRRIKEAPPVTIWDRSF